LHIIVIIPLSKDIMRVPSNEILDSRVEVTIIAGKIAWQATR
jgi:hypothetical protein